MPQVNDLFLRVPIFGENYLEHFVLIVVSVLSLIEFLGIVMLLIYRRKMKV